MTILRKQLICERCGKDWCECPEQVSKKSRTLHDLLVVRAEEWLKRQGCKVVIRDPFRCSNWEQPDAIGWRSGVSILIEAKVSRSDFLADKKKFFRQHPGNGMGDWRFFLCPPETIDATELPEGWGLLWAHEKNITKVQGIPTNTGWGSPPNLGHKRNENTMLVSALRRLTIRGHMPEIYEDLRKYQSRVANLQAS